MQDVRRFGDIENCVRFLGNFVCFWRKCDEKWENLTREKVTVYILKFEIPHPDKSGFGMTGNRKWKRNGRNFAERNFSRSSLYI